MLTSGFERIHKKNRKQQENHAKTYCKAINVTESSKQGRLEKELAAYILYYNIFMLNVLIE